MKLIAGMIAFMLCATPLWASDYATDRIKNLRAQYGMDPLVLSPKLQLAAQRHADDMAKRGYYSHTGADGSSAGKRANRARYRWCIVAENIAKGQKDIGQVMTDWQNSPSHRKNMTLRQIREYGLARSGNVWVMMLGARRC